MSHKEHTQSVTEPTSDRIETPNGSKTWVKFDEEDEKENSNSNVALKQIQSTSNIQRVPNGDGISAAAILPAETVQVNLELDHQPVLKKNVEFVNVRQGFVNGDIIVTLLPVNTKWPWITAARFKPELVPEELMAQGLTLTVEEYVHAMELLVNDVRFTMYNVCYKRVIICWILLAFLVLLALLVSGLTGLTLFSLGVFWLILNAAAIFLCMWIKMKLSKGLEQCLASVNKLLSKHKILIALDDRGKISCHKVNLCFLYFDSGPCIAHLQQFIEREQGNTIPEGWEQRLDVTTADIVIQGSQSTRLSRKQEVSESVLLRYAQRWGKDYLRRRLDWTLDEEGGYGVAPRHLQRALCPCQYAEDILRNKQPHDSRACCPRCDHWMRSRGID